MIKQSDVLEAMQRVMAKAQQYQSHEVISKHVIPSLLDLKKLVEAQWPLANAAKEKISIGPFAAKNIEDWNPKLADSLMTLSYALRHDGKNIEILLNEDKSTAVRFEL